MIIASVPSVSYDSVEKFRSAYIEDCLNTFVGYLSRRYSAQCLQSCPSSCTIPTPIYLNGNLQRYLQSKMFCGSYIVLGGTNREKLQIAALQKKPIILCCILCSSYIQRFCGILNARVREIHTGTGGDVFLWSIIRRLRRSFDFYFQ